MNLEFIAHPQAVARIGDFLKECLRSKEWRCFRAAVAFVKRSGTKHICDELLAFGQQGGLIKITAGIDAGGTSVEGLTDLINAVPKPGQVLVFKNANSSTFHPKVYLFKNEKAAAILIGSGNLTEGGLYTNYEASFLVRLNLAEPQHAALLASVEKTLDEWSTPTDGLCYVADLELVKTLAESGDLPDEAHTRTIDDKKAQAKTDAGATTASLFKWLKVPGAPKVAKPTQEPEEPADEGAESEDDAAKDLVVVIPSPAPAQNGTNRIFLMTLQRTDVGMGQTTAGTQRRSPEIFIPLVARNSDPDFWGWPEKFEPDAGWKGPIDADGRGKMDRTGVLVRLGADVFPVVFWYNPDKKDLRLRSEHMRSAGNIGDILYVERSDGAAGFSYYVEVIPQSSAKHATYLAQCTNDVRNSKKKWGYL